MHPSASPEVEHWLGRRRLERKLHDGASLRISALALRVGLLRHRNAPDRDGPGRSAGDEGDRWREDMGAIQDELHAVLQELRQVAAEIYPPLLDQAGLEAALREFAHQRGLDLDLAVERERCGPVAEGAAYFAAVHWLERRPESAEPVRVTVARERVEDHWELVMLVASDQPGEETLTMRIPCE